MGNDSAINDFRIDPSVKLFLFFIMRKLINPGSQGLMVVFIRKSANQKKAFKLNKKIE